MTSSPLLAMVIEGHNVVAELRKLMGPTNPTECAPGTIRGDFCVHISRNIIHGSDTNESAKKEISLWFPEKVCEWKLTQHQWLYDS